jgi:glutamine amidotransferase
VTRRTIGIVDYGAGNLSSVQRAMNALGYRSRVSGDQHVLEQTDVLILPGVGAFPAAMACLIASGLDQYVIAKARTGKPIIGICLGMHMLVDASDEHGLTAGLGLIPGQVRQIPDKRWHIGWNSLEVLGENPLMRPSDGQSFYFNHSYAIEVPDEYRAGAVRIPDPITVAIRRRNIVGLQFHPEKSQGAGRELLSNLVEGLCQ